MSTSRPVPKGPKVSPARTIVSLVVLLIVGTVCVIELRAGLGQYLTGKALTAKQKVDPQNGAGVFEQLSMDDARSLVKMFPTESVHRDDENEIVYRYQWYSMLRGLIGEKNPEIYISSSKGDRTPGGLPQAPPIARVAVEAAVARPARVAVAGVRRRRVPRG